MTKASVARFLGFAIPAVVMLVALAQTRSWWLFLLAPIVLIAAGMVTERWYRLLASPEEQRRDLEDRLRNPPS